MSKISLTLGCLDLFDRTRPLIDGQVEIPGIDLICVPLTPRELDARFAEFDVAETIMVPYMAHRSRGDDRFVAIPVFPYRGFHLANVIVNVSSGIERPEELKGKRVGTSGFHLSGTLWTRGFLEDRYGVKGTDMRWFVARQTKFELLSDIKVEVLPPDQTLSEMLERGEIDAVIGSSPPECFERKSPRVRRLFPDYRQVEEEHARQAGFLPIIHTVVMRTAIYRHHPWIANSLVRAFQRAKEIGISRLINSGVPVVSLPWVRDDFEALEGIFRGDWYRYGFRSNQDVLTTMTRYAVKQGIVPPQFELATLFAPETLD